MANSKIARGENHASEALLGRMQDQIAQLYRLVPGINGGGSVDAPFSVGGYTFDQGGQIDLSALPRVPDLPRGIVAGPIWMDATSYTNATATETIVTGTSTLDSAIANLSLQVSVDPTRRYKACVHFRASNVTASAIGLIRFHVDSTSYAAHLWPLISTATSCFYNMPLQPAAFAATSITVSVFAASSGAVGTFTAAASATTPLTFWVEDMGRLS